MEDRTITIFGGSGFLGKYLVSNLAKYNFKINVISRNPSQSNFLKTAGKVGQIHISYCDIHDEIALSKLVKKSDIIINLIGIRYQGGKNTFNFIHHKFPGLLSRLCKKYNIQKFIHLSTLGADIGKSKYCKTKLSGEKAVADNIKNYYIIRPNIMFGEGSNFLNPFVRISRFMPFIPIIGLGKTKFQPIYVGDVAEAITRIITHDNHTPGLYELSGLETVSLKTILGYTLKSKNGKSKNFLPIPFKIAEILGYIFESFPNPIFSKDQVDFLKQDYIQKNNNVILFKDLKITPVPIALLSI